TSALDTVVQSAILELLQRLRDQRRLAVVLITHDLDVAAATADRVVVLDDGRVTAEGPPAMMLPGVVTR
ncbi:MAG: ABC transporter ATP-binding protein, partial [Pseudonocardia sp.]|nr:ABC transporter ATP-binding protein [Pseudonocardia sp.]